MRNSRNVRPWVRTPHDNLLTKDFHRSFFNPSIFHNFSISKLKVPQKLNISASHDISFFQISDHTLQTSLYENKSWFANKNTNIFRHHHHHKPNLNFILFPGESLKLWVLQLFCLHWFQWTRNKRENRENVCKFIFLVNDGKKMMKIYGPTVKLRPLKRLNNEIIV